MEIGHPLVQRVECRHRTPDEVEEPLVGFALLDQPVEHLGHEERDGRLADVERQRLQHDPAADLAEAVHLHARRLQPLELHGEHRLEQRQLRPVAACRPDALHHVALPPAAVGEQVDDHSRIAVFERVQHDAARLVGFHTHDRPAPTGILFAFGIYRSNVSAPK